MRGHIHKLWINRKMGWTATKGERRFARIAISAVLLNSVLNILSCEWILEFSREDWQAIEKQHKIQTIIVAFAKVQLAYLAKKVGAIEAQ
jgi:hypothetical protein